MDAVCVFPVRVLITRAQMTADPRLIADRANHTVREPTDPNAQKPSVQFSFFAVPPRSLHHRLKGRLRSPRSTQVLSTHSLGLLNFAKALTREERHKRLRHAFTY